MSLKELVVQKLDGLPIERQQEVLDFVEFLQSKNSKLPRRNPIGLLADLNISISSVEIDEARHEMWSNFPREIDL